MSPASLVRWLRRLAVAGLVVAGLAAWPAGASAEVLVGSAVIEPGSDANASGFAEAFRYTATASGSANVLNVYVASGSSATKLVAGLYADNAGRPGTLLAQGSVTSPVPGAWSAVTVASTPVTAGTTYWIAILGTGGTLRFRDRCCGGGGTPAEGSAQSTLTTLPGTWSPGTRWADGPASMYASNDAPPPPPPPPPPSAGTIGQWGPLESWPLVAIHAMMMNNGKLLLMDGWQQPNDTHVYDPATQAVVPAPSPFTPFRNQFGLDLFCAAHVTLADGRIAVVGGHSTSQLGIDDTLLFDPATSTWTAAPKMSFRRWYPTLTELGDGRLVVISGNDNFGSWADTPEIYDPAANTWTRMTGVSTSQVHEEEYPLSFLLPNGKIFTMATSAGRSYLLDPDAPSFTAAGSTSGLNGSATMYRPGKILYTGGGTPLNSTSPSRATAQTIDLSSGGTPTWQATSDMATPRYSHNLVTLPDGKVLAVGGDEDMNQYDPDRGVVTTEQWDPATGQWAPMANIGAPRVYHSTAMLMPDGRVLSAGGGHSQGFNGPGQRNAQYFSPPYLFKGARPRITAAPDSARYGSTVTVDTPDATSIASVSLVSMGSVTHTLDMNQHFVPLTFTKGSGALSVQMPDVASVAPPGTYMLFIVNEAGVPSVATNVKVLPRAADAQAPSIPSGLTADGGLGRVTLNWNAAVDDVAVTGYDVHRSSSPGFTLSAANRIGQPTGTSLVDSPLAAGTYHYRVIARDAAGNRSDPSAEASAAVTADTTAPTASVTAPAGGTTVSGNVPVTATAADDVGITGVRFRLDGVDLGPEDTTAPYAVTWNTTASSNAAHTLTAVARDAAGNTTTSPPVTVTVLNAAPTGLVAAYGFEELTGPSVADRSGLLNDGMISGATRTSAGKNGSALSFDGVDDWVTVADSSSLDLTTNMTLEAWIRPTAGGSWRTALLKERAGGLAYALYTSNSAGRPAQYLSIGGADRALNGVSALALNTWTHVAATYDGATTRLYVNGAQVSSAARTGAAVTTTGPLRLGGNGIWPEWFAGQLDDVRVYNRALTTAQIQADMAKAAG